MLGIDEVGIHDDFYELGGHSLLAVELFAKIEEMVGIELPADIFLGHQTVARHAEVLSELMAGTTVA